MRRRAFQEVERDRKPALRAAPERPPERPSALRELQRAAGNRAVAALLRERTDYVLPSPPHSVAAEIQVESFSWGGVRSASPIGTATFEGIGSGPVLSYHFVSDVGAGGGGSGPGKANLHELVLTIPADKLSAELRQAMNSGRGIPAVEMVVTGSTNQRIVIRLEGVSISWMTGSSNAAGQELETMQLDFAQLKWSRGD